MNVWGSISLGKRKLALWFLGLLAFYAIVGLLILPPIIRYAAVKILSQQLNREVSIKKIKIDPFTLSATVDGLLIQEKDGQPFVSWDEVYVNFQLSSFFGHAWVFKEINVTKPFVHAQMNRDGTFNFSDLIAKFSTNAAPAGKKSAPLALRIEHLHIGGATAALADFTPREPFQRTAGPFEITLEDFRTDPANKNPYAFSGLTPAGERIAWTGFFYLNPLSSQGELTLDNLTLNQYAPLYQDLVRFEIRDGTVGFHLNYQFELTSNNCVALVNDASFALRDLKVAPVGATNNIVEVPFFSVTGASVDLGKNQATVNAIYADGSKLFLTRDQDKNINVVELSKPADAATNLPGGVLFLLHSVTNVVAQLLNSTNAWSATLRSVTSTNGSIFVADNANARPVKVALTDITFTAENVSNLRGTNFTSALSLRWNQDGSIKTKTVASLAPPTFEVALDLDQVDLSPLSPYVKLDLLVLGGKLGLHGQAHLVTPRGELPAVTFSGDASLDGLHTVDGFSGDDLLKWDSVKVDAIQANLNPLTVAIQKIAVNQAYARLIIETNHTINLLNVLRLTVTNGVTPNTVKVAVVRKNPVAPDSLLPQITLGELSLTNTTASFTDRSLEPNVNLAVEQVNGTLAGLSSAELQHADLDLSAKVEGVGPAHITGQINPFSPQSTNDIQISLRDMDLTPTSPYVGKFAGYRLAEGKLDLELTYEIVGRKLSSKNLVTLDQFTFGQAVASPEATHLPVRLAIAILKDRAGKIVLDVPIEGNLDDPKFRIGKVVLRAIVNILEKAATSPFSLLSAAFGGGGEELGYQDFAPGSAELSAADQKKLDSLGKGLFARPALQLEISGSVASDADREGLQRAALDHEIRARIWSQLHASERATNSVDQTVLTPEDRARWLGKIYAEAVAAGKINNALIAANTNLAVYAASVLPQPANMEKGAALLMKRDSAPKPTTTNGPPVYQTKLVPPPSPTEAVLLSTYAIGENDLAALATARAKAVKDYLLQNGKVEATRLFITTKNGTLRHDGSRAYEQFR